MYILLTEAQSLHKIDNFITCISYKTAIQYVQNVPLCNVHRIYFVFVSRS